MMGITNILSLGLVQKHHLVTYNSRNGNEFVVYIPQQMTLKMTKDGLLYHDTRHLIKNKNNAHTMVNYSHSSIPQFEEKKKHYTSHNVKRADSARKFQHITGKKVNRILHAVDNRILQTPPIIL